MDNQSIYQKAGYANRREYLDSLAEDYYVAISVVLELASLLGPDEDFDGLVNALEDASEWSNGTSYISGCLE